MSCFGRLFENSRLSVPSLRRFPVASQDVVICSFYTDDPYYREYGEKLRKNLDALGLSHELREIHKSEGEEWPDICRKKISFLADVCERYPDKKVFWMDVDCNLLSLPDYVRNSTADLIGFLRGFGNALGIGYANRARFWEPCFWGINTSEAARKFIRDAATLEASSPLRATDDYFFEESWRANANRLTFQVIPSKCVVGKGETTMDAFFTFGSSGNVAEFKGKVEQHVRQGGSARPRLSVKQLLMKVIKKAEATLPGSLGRKMRKILDGAGITGFLVKKAEGAGDPVRQRALRDLLHAGFQTQPTDFESRLKSFEASYIPSDHEAKTIKAAKSFSYYASRPSDSQLDLAWWASPFPGNFGDWLSPLIVGHYTDAKIIYQSVTKTAHHNHIFGLGSIGRFIKSNSIVAGTGISTDDLELNTNAQYVSVRGPITARVLRESGGPSVERFGDPGIVLSRVIPLVRGTTNGRVAVVRHHTHRKAPIQLAPHMDEIELLMSSKEDITELLTTLLQYDSIVTSAMHIFISCQSYGIPCALVTFEGFEEKVHGNGIKYSDYALGAGLSAIDPAVVALDLRTVNFDDITTDERVSAAKMDEVESAIRDSIAIALKK